MKKVCCQLSLFSHTQERRDPYTNLVRVKNESQVGKWKTKESGLSLKDKKSKLSLKSEPRFKNTSSKPILIEEVSRRWMELSSLRREIDHTLAGDEQLRRDQLHLHEQLSEQNRDLREAHVKSLDEMLELKRFQGSTFDEFSRRRLIEDRDTVLEFLVRIQELQNEISCVNDSRDLKDAESVRSGLSHVPSEPALFPLFRDSGGMLSRSVRMPSGNNGPPDIWDTHGGASGNIFSVNPTASSSAPFPQGFNPWISNVPEHTSSHVTSARQTPDTTLGPRCQSGWPARNSIDPSEGRCSKNYGTNRQRLQISDFSFWQNPYTSHVSLLADKIQDWGMYLLTISYWRYVVDQRSGDGWIGGWSQIFAFYQKNSWSKLWVTWRENCFSTEQNHQEYPLKTWTLKT